MGNIEITPNSTDSITIDISDITTEQRRLLAATIGWTSDNPVPLLACLLMDSMNARKEQVKEIIRREALLAANAVIATQVDTL